MNSRRAFIAVLSGAAAGWALAAADRRDAVRVIGFLRSASLADAKHLTTAFQQGLRETGFVDARSRHERLPPRMPQNPPRTALNEPDAETAPGLIRLKDRGSSNLFSPLKVAKRCVGRA